MLNTYFYMCFEFFVDEGGLKKEVGKGRPLLVPWLWLWEGFCPCRLDTVWKHIHIFWEATICPSPVHFIFSWHLSNWARWKMFPTLRSLSPCQPFNFTVPNLLLIRLQNVSSWLRVQYILVKINSSLFSGQPSFRTVTFLLSSLVQKLFVIAYTFPFIFKSDT